jgi:excisionase family DNA binding protein
MPLDRFIAVKALPERLGVSLRTVWRLLADGTLHGIRVRRRVLVAESEVRAYMERLKLGASGPAGAA